MPTFVLSLDFTEQGVRTIKDAPKRAKAARELAQKLHVDIQQVFLTTGEHDLLLIAQAPDGENIAKFALALSSLGNVRTHTERAWPESEFLKVVSELP